MEVGVCRLLSQIQWQTLLMQTPGEALIPTLSGKIAAESSATRKWDRAGLKQHRGLLALPERSVWMCLPLSKVPTFSLQYPTPWKWGSWIQKHTHTNRDIHTCTSKRLTIREWGRLTSPDRHLTRESPPPPIPSLHWPSHPPPPASFVSHKCSSLEAD